MLCLLHRLPLPRKWGSSRCVLHLFGIEYPVPLRPKLTAKAFLLSTAQLWVAVPLKLTKAGQGGPAPKGAAPL